MEEKVPRDVLVVEDDQAIASLYEQLLASESIPMRIARTGHEALRLAEEQRPAVAVVDLGLPGLYGASLATSLKAKWRDLPIIVVSALPGSTVAEDAWHCQAFAYFTKPFDTDQLLAAINRALAPAGQRLHGSARLAAQENVSRLATSELHVAS